MIIVRFIAKPKKEGASLGIRDENFVTLHEANEAIRKSGSLPGQWLDLPGQKIKIAWLPVD